MKPPRKTEQQEFDEEFDAAQMWFALNKIGPRAFYAEIPSEQALAALRYLRREGMVAYKAQGEGYWITLLVRTKTPQRS